MTESLIERFGIIRPELVAFVGGGGKSTLTLRLGSELAEAGRRVTLATTTKMGASQIPQWTTVCHEASDAIAAMQHGRPAFLLDRVDGEKVIGVAPEVVDEVFAAGDTTILVEADGARRKPCKAPQPGEPVIPRATTLVVVVVGADAIGGRITDVCHRPERVAALTGRGLNDSIRPEDIATLVSHPDGGCKGVPPDTRTVMALTKLARQHEPAAAKIAGLIAPMPLVAIPATST